MNAANGILSIVFIFGALVLAYYNLRGHDLSKQKVFKLAAIWAAIIVGLVLILRLALPS